jgi:hypothetical protein
MSRLKQTRAVTLATALAAVLAANGVASGWLGVRAQTPPTQPDVVPAPKGIVDTGELMEFLVRPAFRDLQAAMTKAPIDRKAWAAVYRSAVRLAEIENLLFCRQPTRYTDRPEFPALAARARDAAATVARLALDGAASATPSDEARLRQAYSDVAGTCTACHRGLGTTNGPSVKP